MKSKNFQEKVLKFLHKFNRFNVREKIFLIYLVVLCIGLLFMPVIKVTLATDLSSSDAIKFGIFNSGKYVGTMIVILVSLIILVGRNVSVKFKNLFSTYFGGKENDALINFLFLFIIIAVYLSIKNTVNIVHNSVTSTVSFTGWGNFVLIWLLFGIIFTLVSVFKGAQRTGKKTKIINVVDEDHNQLESTKDEIKKGLFNEEEME